MYSKEKKKEYAKAYYQAHKKEMKESCKKWREAHKKERKEYFKKWCEAHEEERKEYGKKWREAHEEERKEYGKKWCEAHEEERKEYFKKWREAHKAQRKAYQKSDLNALGESKHSIRTKSNYILKKMNLHIPGYQIHHCFGYEDASKFIYISKSLHLKIHQYLRDNNIDASSDHWMDIRDMVNSTDEFKYIKC